MRVCLYRQVQSLHNELATLQQPVYLPEARHNFRDQIMMLA